MFLYGDKEHYLAFKSAVVFSYRNPRECMHCLVSFITHQSPILPNPGQRIHRDMHRNSLAEIPQAMLQRSFSSKSSAETFGGFADVSLTSAIFG